jgi:RNA polymerase sigma-70 factor (ECF subfamily)
MGSGFGTTDWSQILAARDGGDTEARSALEWLCTSYWYPAYVFVRRQVHDSESARDLTQAFFTDMLERGALARVDRGKGRFRDFLLASLRNFLAHQRDRAMALKRGGGAQTFSLDADEAERRFRREPVDGLTPDQIFERRWALALMERAMEHLRTESSSSADGATAFDRLQPYLTGAEPHLPYREVAGELGRNEAAVKSAVHRLRRRYGELLREEIAATLAEPHAQAQIDAELRHLLAVVQPWESASG